MLKLFQPHRVKISPIITDSRQKEKLQYSSSKELHSLINQLIPVLKSKGFKTQASRLETIRDTFAMKLEKLFTVEDDEPKEKTKHDNTQQEQAIKVVMDVIKNLPKEVQHSVRTEVARKGNTLQALSQVLRSKGIKV